MRPKKLPEYKRIGTLAVLLCMISVVVKLAAACEGEAPAPGFACEGPNWVYHGDFWYDGPEGLIFDGSSYVLGTFTFIASGTNFVTFKYNSYLRVQGIATFDDAVAWNIFVTPQQARDMWRHRSDRNVSYVQAEELIYNAKTIRLTSSDTCTTITGIAKTVNTTLPVSSQILVVEFTQLHTYATCHIWWIIPLILVIVAAIIAIALFCYFRGRNKKAEDENYIPVSDPDSAYQHGLDSEVDAPNH
jgi:hypothetical protein